MRTELQRNQRQMVQWLLRCVVEAGDCWLYGSGNTEYGTGVSGEIEIDTACL
jgi:hypothetical protein